MPIHVNRTLNLKKIKAIGFDMDHTLVRYHTEKFEQLSYETIKQKLVSKRGYPKQILSLKFDMERTIRGLVIDRRNGNLLKLSLYGRIKSSAHGLRPLSFQQQRSYYGGQFIDLNEANFDCIDTSFSLSLCCLYAQLVDLKDMNQLTLADGETPNYGKIIEDVEQVLDESHADGSIKNVVAEDISNYIIQDQKAVDALERFSQSGKQLWIITNSDYAYTKLLLEYAINPLLKSHKDWKDLFALVITSACKPRFFTDNLPFLKVHEDKNLLQNHHERIAAGVFQGGCAAKLQKDLELTGDQILYLGDHIYGDIVSLKKTCQWRTALVIDELWKETEGLKKSGPIQKEIDKLMEEKVKLEEEYNKTEPSSDTIYAQIEKIDQQLSGLIEKYQHNFNPFWGEVMRAGFEQSRFGGQVEKYACIYMSSIADFYDYSPKTYFRPAKRYLPHELNLEKES